MSAKNVTDHLGARKPPDAPSAVLLAVCFEGVSACVISGDVHLVSHSPIQLQDSRRANFTASIATCIQPKVFFSLSSNPQVSQPQIK